MKLDEIKDNATIWKLSLKGLFDSLNTSEKGLTSQEAEKRLLKYGYNEIKKEKQFKALSIFFRQFESPLVAILIFATIIAFFMGDRIEALIILIIILINSCLSFFQEYKAERTFQLLKKYIVLRTEVLRDGNKIEIDSKKIVPGDIIFLTIGDIVPADIRLIYSKNLTIDESTLTGESIPSHKKAISENIITSQSNPVYATHITFTGTSVTSGTGYGIVIATSNQTYLGQIAQNLQKPETVTAFHKNINKFGILLIKITLSLAIIIFIINTIMGKDLLDSVLFALALAIGITPELLPIIITITSSQGAMHMARKKVIVKKLSSIENLGNMDILCCDKTGTLTEGIFSLENYINLDGINDEKIYLYGLLCSSIDLNINEKNISNPMDKAILDMANEKILSDYHKYQIIDKTEFDFTRRRMSCIAKNNEQKIFIVKGSPDSILTVCDSAIINNKLINISGVLNQINQKIENFENSGYRVISIAFKESNLDKIEIEDEKNLTLLGFLIFMDPPKTTAKESLEKIKSLNVKIKVITGDSPIITRKICNELGVLIEEDKIITGDMLEKLDEHSSYNYYLKYNIFARITPEQKANIVAMLNKNEHIIGFLGDGVNDALALKSADVGISVDSGSEITKDIADIILLKKSLRILSDGVILGRNTFANTIKYILNVISSNFGNIMTIALFSILLPFLPLLPAQILLSNLLIDLTLISISTDNVDEEFTIKPRTWNIPLIAKFMILFGLISTFYDLLFIIPLNYWIKVPKEQFRTALFTLSCLEEILVTFLIRTKKPFWKSRPSNLLIILSIITGIIVLILPYTSFGNKFFQFNSLNKETLLLISIIIILYCITIEIFKIYFFKKLEE